MLSAEKHPQADKLQVLSVDAGEGPVQVVCGAPNARAGRDRSAAVGASVELDGSASDDPNNDPVSFQWSVTSVPAGSGITTASLAGAATASPYFTPDVAGAYVLTLLASDGALTDEDTVQVTAGPSNVRPYADAGADRGSRTAETAALDGSGSSDPDGGPSPPASDAPSSASRIAGSPRPRSRRSRIRRRRTSASAS